MSPARVPIFAVGITGHRPNKLPPERREGVSLALAGVLEVVARTADERASAAEPAADDARARLHLVSALAEGADRLAVEAAPPRWSLRALLPMRQEHYEIDFSDRPGIGGTASSREVFRAMLAAADGVRELPPIGGMQAPAGEGRDAHYAALGRELVRAVDVLVAVWDGEAAAGPGGTATVVAEALSHGVPVVWVDPEAAERPRLLAGIEPEAGRRPVGTVLDAFSLRAALSGRWPPQAEATSEPPLPPTIAEHRADT